MTTGKDSFLSESFKSSSCLHTEENVDLIMELRKNPIGQRDKELQHHILPARYLKSILEEIMYCNRNSLNITKTFTMFSFQMLKIPLLGMYLKKRSQICTNNQLHGYSTIFKKIIKIQKPAKYAKLSSAYMTKLVLSALEIFKVGLCLFFTLITDSTNFGKGVEKPKHSCCW